MPRMDKTEKDWNGLKLGFLKTVQPNSFSKLIPAACNFKNNAQETFVCLGSLILSFTCNFFAYFKVHSDWGRVIGKIKSPHVRESMTVLDSGFLPCGFRIPAQWIPDSKKGWIPNFFCFNAFRRISFSCLNLAILEDVV